MEDGNKGKNANPLNIFRFSNGTGEPPSAAFKAT